MTLITGELPTELPLNSDGEQWAFAMTLGDNTLFADNLTNLVSHIIAGYDAAESVEDAWDLRTNAAVNRANTAQLSVLAALHEEGEFDPSKENEDVITALMSSREEPLTGFTEWKHKVPLVLVATNYAPYSATPLPTGNVVTINPYTERTLLDSLASLGDIEFFVA